MNNTKFTRIKSAIEELELALLAIDKEFRKETAPDKDALRQHRMVWLALETMTIIRRLASEIGVEISVSR